MRAVQLPSFIFCVTVKILPVSSGTVQFTGSGDRIMICSGDFTRVGSGGDLTSGSSGTITGIAVAKAEPGNGLQLDTEMAVSRP